MKKLTDAQIQARLVSARSFATKTLGNGKHTWDSKVWFQNANEASYQRLRNLQEELTT